MVAGQQHAGVQRRGAHRAAGALAVARRCRARGVAAGTATPASSSISNWWNGRAFDGTRIPGWLALAGAVPCQAGYPAIIWVHGGPVGQTRPNFRPDIQMLLAQGFAVLMPNVRGSSGYGRTYTESDDVERRLDSVTDLAHGRPGSPRIRRSMPSASASWASHTAGSW